MSPRFEPENITVYRCGDGHTFFFHHDACPECGGTLDAESEGSKARLISHTVVRVNPTGDPYRLGIAEIAGGTKTLCIVQGDIPSGETVVSLRSKNGLYHATPRATSRNR